MKRSILVLAMAGLFGASAGAQADSFATSYNNVTNLLVTPTQLVTPGTSSNTSETKACLPNGTCVNGGGAGVKDSPVSQINAPGYVANSYTSQEASATSYALSDASIDSTQLSGAAFTQARAIAEAKLVGNSTASANSGNSSSTVIRSTYTVGEGGTIAFTFDADPYIKAYISSDSLIPSVASASITLSFTIADSQGNTVFAWAPDGRVGGISGGTEIADAFSLNSTITALVGNGGPLVYNPLGGFGSFAATSDALAAGTYTLNLSMGQGVNLVSAVPEPETYGMMLGGLALLGFVARRRKMKA